MTDFRAIWHAERFYADWAFAEGPTSEGGGLATDPGLETAVILSLMTDRLAEPSDALPAGERDRRGHWADDVNGWRKGSRLWLLAREKWTEETRLKAEAYIREALDWMIEDGVADAIEVTARRSDLGTIVADIKIFRDGAALIDRPFGPLWQSQLPGQN